MMGDLLKLFLLTTLLIIITLSSSAQDPFSPYKNAKPKGKIDTVIIIAENANGKHIYIYNKHRQLIEVTQYRDEVFPDGIGRVLDTVKTQYHYGANKRLLSSIMIFKGGKKAFARYEYLPKKSGYAIRTIDSRVKDSSVVNEMRFNHSGQIIQCGYYALNDLEQQRPGNFDYQYDKKANMIQSTIYFMGKVEPGKVFYKYDADGNLITQTRMTGHGPLTFNFTYTKFDKMHNWLVQNVYRDSDFLHKTYRRITYYK